MTLNRLLLALCLAVVVIVDSDWSRPRVVSLHAIATWLAVAFLSVGFPYAVFRFVRGVIAEETSERFRKNA